MTRPIDPLNHAVPIVDNGGRPTQQFLRQWGQLTTVPTAYAPSGHTHSWGEITDKPTTFVPSPHTHSWGEITDKPTTFVPSPHTHPWDEVTDKPATFAPSAHSHPAEDVTAGVFPGAAYAFSGYVDFSAIAAPAAPAAGSARVWAGDEQGHSVLHYTDASGIDIELGRDSFQVVRNETGATITKGSVVYIIGANGQVPTVGLADASSNATMPAIGIAAEDITSPGFGMVTTFGDLRMDTSAWANGAELFVSETAGELTTTPPSTQRQRIGIVINGVTANGSVKVRGAGDYVDQGIPYTWGALHTFNAGISVVGDVAWTGTLTAGAVPWARLTGVPATFTPSAHTHPTSDLTGWPANAAGFLENDGAGNLSWGAPSVGAHTHPASDITAGTFGAGNFTVNGSFSVVGNISMRSTGPQISWYETGAAFQEKNWRIVAEAGTLYFQGREDDGEPFANPTFLVFRRSGVTASSVRIYPRLVLDGDLELAGSLTSGTVPAARVAAGTFGAGDFTFPAFVNVTGGVRVGFASGTAGQVMEPGNTTITTLRFDADRWRLYSGGVAQEIFSVYETGHFVMTGAGNDRLTLNHTSATGSPKLEFQQNAVQRAYLQYFDDVDRLVINSTTSGARMELHAGGAERLSISSNGIIAEGGNWFRLTTGGKFEATSESNRDKFRVYPGSSYCIGMQSGVMFGGLADWAMTFQFNNDADRGFWWGDDGHTTSQGAMALTTDGRLTVAHSARIGFGEGDTTTPGSTGALQLGGDLDLNGNDLLNVGSLGSFMKTLHRDMTTATHTGAAMAFNVPLRTISVPAGTVGGVRFTAWGEAVGLGDSKYVSVWWDGTVVFSRIITAAQRGWWRIDVDIHRVSATSQRAVFTFVHANGTVARTETDQAMSSVNSDTTAINLQVGGYILSGSDALHVYGTVAVTIP